jgi:glycosyltransferase involved in cell wall biosynthesis
MPSVSAILLCYNCETLVADAVRSLLAQDYAGPVEVVVSDDASTDRTYEVACRELAHCRSSWQVRTFRRQANTGSKSAHLNAVFPETTGDILVSFDADDVAEPMRIRRIVEAFSSGASTQAVFSALSLMDPEGRPLGPGRIPFPSSRSDTRRWFARVDAYAAGSTLAVRRSVVDSFGPLDPDVPEDVVLPFRASLLGEVVYLDERLVRYRRHAASLTANFERFESLAAYRKRMLEGIERARRNRETRLADLHRARQLMPGRTDEFALLERIVEESMDDAALTADLVSPSFRKRSSALLQLIRRGAYRDEWLLNAALALAPETYLRYKRRARAVNAPSAGTIRR